MMSLVAGRPLFLDAVRKASVSVAAQRLAIAASTVSGSDFHLLPNSNNHSNNGSVRSFSSKNKKFSPRRRPSANYRPVAPRGDKYQNKKGDKGFPYGHNKIFRHGDHITRLGGDEQNPATGSELDPYDEDGLSAQFGPQIARGIRTMQREQSVFKGRKPTVDDFLRDMDYLTAAPGSTEDLMGERRALSFETSSEEEKEKFLKDLDDMVERQRVKDLELEPYEDPFEEDGKPGPVNMDMNDPFTSINPNQLAYGEW